MDSSAARSQDTFWGDTSLSARRPTARGSAGPGPPPHAASPFPADLPSAETVGISKQRPDRDGMLRRVLAVSDLLAVAGAWALVILAAVPASAAYLAWGFLGLPVWAVVFKAYGLYDRAVGRISHSLLDDLPQLFHALLLGGLVWWGYHELLPVEPPGFAMLAEFCAAAFGTVLIGRAVAKRAVLAALGPAPVLLVGDEPVESPLLRKIAAHPEYGLQPVGVLHAGQNGRTCEVPLLGELGDLAEVVERHRVERIIVANHGMGDDTLVDLLRWCKRHGIHASVLPAMADVMGPSMKIDEVEGVTVLALSPPVLSRGARLAKRIFDVTVGSVALVVLSPLLLGVAALIRLSSPGPAFFHQDRVGARGRLFRVVKFRTMVADAERLRNDLMSASRDSRWLDLEHDPRVTRLGKVLRATSLDELPQLWNVVKGEMSLVGPRPLPVAEDKAITGWNRARLDLTPGITGLWQVLGRTAIPFDEMVKLDYLYVTNWSLWRDVRLMIQTLGPVFRRRGTN